jgi:hypothetical protein
MGVKKCVHNFDGRSLFTIVHWKSSEGSVRGQHARGLRAVGYEHRKQLEGWVLCLWYGNFGSLLLPVLIRMKSVRLYARHDKAKGSV